MDPITQQQALVAAGAGGDPVYVDDVFSVDLWEGNATSGRNLTLGRFGTNMDFSERGGMWWTKVRNMSGDWNWYYTDSPGKRILPNDNLAELSAGNPSAVTFQSSGVQLTSTSDVNGNGRRYVGHAFLKEPGFFDCVKFTGNGVNNRAISHNLACKPGMIIVKNLDDAESPVVWHKDMSGYMYTSTPDYLRTSTGSWGTNHGRPGNASTFQVGDQPQTNYSGKDYVAFLWADGDDTAAQIFGDNKNEAIIKCGTYQGQGGGNFEVNLGFEPQFVFVKKIDTGSSGNAHAGWSVFDVTRGIHSQYACQLTLNESAGESQNTYVSNRNYIEATRDGFKVDPAGQGWTNTNSSGAWYMYMAVRRPHKPYDASLNTVHVYDAIEYQGNGNTERQLNTNLEQADWFITKRIDASGYAARMFSRMGGNKERFCNDVSVEYLSGWVNDNSYNAWGRYTESQVALSNHSSVNGNNDSYVMHAFRRIQGCMDMVRYDGTGTSNNHSVLHRLGAVPKMVISKSISNAGYDWWVYHSDLGYNNALKMNDADGSGAHGVWANTIFWNGDSYISVTGNANTATVRYEAILFADMEGVCKVGSYNGNGSGDVTVNCGFQPSFILWKRHNGSGNWDMACSDTGLGNNNPDGTVNDPYWSWNRTDSQNTSNNVFEVSSTGFTAKNNYSANYGSGYNYIFLALK